MSSGTRRISTLVMAAIMVGLMLPASVLGAEPTTTSLSGPSSTPGWYEPFHMLALVRPSPDEAGLVTLSRDGLDVATDWTTPNGAANFSLPGLAPGTYEFVATFAGTADSLPSTSDPIDVTTIDGRTPITISVESGANPSLRGDSVPFTVTIDPVPDAGQVSVYHESSATHEPLDPSGTNVIDHPMRDAGTFTVHACFGGSSEYQDTCTTVGIEQEVVAYDTTTTFSIEPMSLYLDEGLIIQVGVDPAPDSPASVIVRRMWDPALWTIPLDPVTGLGELEVSGEDVATRLHWGENELIAQYGGSDHMNQSNSDTLVVVGKRDATTLELALEDSTTTPGGSVTATAVVSPAPPAGSLVEFFFRGPPVQYIYGTGTTDANGVASATVSSISNWPVGEYAVLEARYLGDLRLAPSLASLPVTIAYLDTVPPSFGFSLFDPDPSTATRSIVVNSAVDGTGSPVVGAELSHDGISWTAMPYAASLPWTLTDGDGIKTVWLRVTDAGGNVSGPGYFTIRLDTTKPTGTVAIAGGSSIVGSTVVTVGTAGVDTGSGLAQVQLSNDGSTWTTRSYAPTQAWTLPGTNGTRTVYVKWRDRVGNWSAIKTDTVVLDTIAPTVTAPRRGFVVGTVVTTSSKINVRLPWTGADAGSGIARYELAQSTDAGAWTTLSTALTSPTTSRSLATGHAYAFRVRGIDKAGNVSGWATGSTFNVSRYQETSSQIAYSGTWTTATGTPFLGGAARRSSQTGAKASFTFSGRSIAWIARQGPDRGRAEIYVNGTKVATVDLYAASYKDRRVTWVGSWTTTASRKVTIKVLGTTGRHRVDLDALITAS